MRSRYQGRRVESGGESSRQSMGYHEHGRSRACMQMAMRHGIAGIYAIIAGRIFACGIAVQPAKPTADRFFSSDRASDFMQDVADLRPRQNDHLHSEDRSNESGFATSLSPAPDMHLSRC
jgi:hypothetical protein